MLTTLLAGVLVASASISASPINHHRREITRQQLDTDELTGMIASCIGHNEDPTPYLAEKHLLESPSCPPEIEIVYVDEGGTPDPDAGGRGGGAGESGLYTDEEPFPETGYARRRVVKRGGGWFGGLFGGSGSGSSGHDHGNSGGSGGSNGDCSNVGGSKTPSRNDDDEPLSIERLSAEWDSSGSGKGSNGGNGRGWGMGDGADDGEGEFRPMGQGWRGGNSGGHGHGSSGGHGKGGSGGGKGGSGGGDWLDFDY